MIEKSDGDSFAAPTPAAEHAGLPSVSPVAPADEPRAVAAESPPARASAVWYYWIFAASGFAGLIYESVWARYLKLFLGHAAYAQALVLAVFLFGLAAGAALCARRSEQVKRPLMWYAGIEILVALAAVYFHEIYVAMQDWMIGFVLPRIASDQAAELAKWSMAVAIILPQSVLLGATFPLMSAGLVRLRPQRRGRLLAMLYFSNSLGAVFGVLCSGFILIPLLGLPGTVAVAGFINALAAFAVWLLGHLFDDRGEAIRAAPPASPAFGGAAAGANARLTTLITAAAFATGVASFVYEIVWIRMLSLLLGASTHNFEIMLAAFILGLALGGLAVYRRVDGAGGDLLVLLGKIQIAMGTLALWSLFFFPLAYDFLREVLSTIRRDDAGYMQYTGLGLGLSLVMMLPATFCAGMTLPLLTRRLMDSGGESAIGRVYAANTLGAIAGVFLAVHLLLPLAGLQMALLAGAFIDMLLGVVLIGFVFRARIVAAFSFCLAVLTAAAVTGGINAKIAAAGVFRFQSDVLPEVIFYRDGKTASIAVTENRDDAAAEALRSIRTNGKPDASLISAGAPSQSGYTGDEMTMVMSGFLPLLYRPDAKRVMNIGFGSGLTTRTLLLSRGIQRLDNVEIEPMMIEGARLLSERTRPVFSDARNHFIIDDAKTVLARAQAPYDIIVSEPSNPWVSGVANLFTKEFYRQVRGSLADNGVFVQWMHLYESTPQLVASMAQALNEEFADYEVYVGPSYADLIFIASAGEALPAKSDAVFAADEARAFLAEYQFRAAGETNALFLGSRELLTPYFESFGAPVNSDYYPYIESAAPKAFFHRYRYVLPEILALPVPILDFLGHAPGAHGDVQPGRHSPLMRGAAASRALYMSRLSPEGEFQTAAQKLTANGCPAPLAAADGGVAVKTAGDIAVNAYMLDISTLIVKFMPYADAAQMRDIWRLLERDECMRALLKDDQNIASLYTQFWKRLSLRQGAEITALMPVLLPAVDLSAPSGQTVFLAAMAAHYQSGEYEQVVAQMLALPADAHPAVRHAAHLMAALAETKF